MGYQSKDHYFKKAKKEDYSARSVFKLKEIDQKHKILKKKFFVLDLGAAPGSWSEYASEKVGPKGFVVGVDLKKINISGPHVDFLQTDIFNEDLANHLREHHLPLRYDTVLSDMAPQTSGIRIQDQTLSYELSQQALLIAKQMLRPGGNFVCKFFQSEYFQDFQSQMKASFQMVYQFIPKSTRKHSKEIFFIGKNKKA